MECLNTEKKFNSLHLSMWVSLWHITATVGQSYGGWLLCGLPCHCFLFREVFHECHSGRHCFSRSIVHAHSLNTQKVFFCAASCWYLVVHPHKDVESTSGFHAFLHNLRVDFQLTPKHTPLARPDPKRILNHQPRT